MRSTPKASDLMVEAGKRLKAARIALGYKTQEPFAAHLQVGLQAYNMYENGARMPNIAAIVRLHGLFGIGPDWIFLGSLASIPYGLAQDLTRAAAEVGATIGGPAPEFPGEVRTGRAPAAVPEQTRRTLHESIERLRDVAETLGSIKP
jgi:transcriptional regulator with XRE-family HTH domain